ncbi:MAG: YitT family protein [Bacilli bacterium]
MWLFKKKEKKDLENLIKKNTIAFNSAIFVIGSLISALSFNLFCVPYSFVGGGLGGISIILNDVFSINPTIVMVIGNTIFIIISLFVLGFKESLMSIVGAIVYTAFVYFTEDIPYLINFSFDNILLYVIAAGFGFGFGESLIYKSGFNSGGTSILALVLQKLIKQPLGVILRYIGFTIVILGGFTFGYTAIMYSIIITTISSSLVDKFLIGISSSKTFYIQTSKKDEVEEFIIKHIESGITELDSSGAFSHKKKKMIMCVVPTDKYALLRNSIKEIDPEAFIVVSDCYEVLGGTKRKKLLFED